MTSSLRFELHNIRLFAELDALPEREQRMTAKLFEFAERAVAALPQMRKPCAYQVFLRPGDLDAEWDERQPGLALHGETSRAALINYLSDLFEVEFQWPEGLILAVDLFHRTPEGCACIIPLTELLGGLSLVVVRCEALRFH